MDNIIDLCYFINSDIFAKIIPVLFCINYQANFFNIFEVFSANFANYSFLHQTWNTKKSIA